MTAVTLAALLSGGAMAIDTPMASAGPAGSQAGPLCEGFSACSLAGYTTHNFQNDYKTSYWGMPPDQDRAPSGAWANCTNYVAFVESTVYGVRTPEPALPVNATSWASGARADGDTVDQIPSVGSVAQWNKNDPSIGADGHVAVVEAVGPSDSYIVISQDNWSSDTDYYGWALILAGTTNEGEPWPDNFIHFPGTGLASTLSSTEPDRLVQSTGNLYWTADHTRGGLSYAEVLRASKDNEPGQERVLYQESSPAGSRPVDFEALTYADVGGSWYGYFVANYPAKNESQIKQVPLTGGGAVVLATSPAVIGNRDLVTDGSYLYWADEDGIDKMAIAGGPVETLVSGETFAHLGLDSAMLYYSSGNSIMRVPTSGGGSSTVVSASSAITAVYPPSPTNSTVYFGEANGSVNLFPGPHDSVYELQAWGAGLSITSVSVAGNYVLWGECFTALAAAAPGHSSGPWQRSCTVVGYDNGSFVSVATSGPPVDVQGDAGGWYWGASDLERFAV